ncbi:hypothetical protein [Nocardioides sp. GXQ0305]|uniref:hypothetical protein n=1 Tax=Nocardioides sp. GXQ0305 TaxID=3423912 RepID=UPI003D7D7F33
MSYTEQSAHVPQTGTYAPVPPKGSNGLAIAGFVLGLLGLLTSWIPFLNVVGIILGVLGVVLAGVGLAKSSKVNAGKGLAIAGIVLGALAVIFAVLINVVFVSAVDEAIDQTTSTRVETPSGSGNEAASEDKAGSDAELGTTRDNPAPLGSGITGDDWTVKINSVKTVRADSMGETPAAGSVLLAINMTATYNGDDEQGSTPWATVDFVSPDGTTIDSTSGSTMFIAENEFDSLKTVFNGASVTGDQLLEVPADTWQDGVLAVSPGMLSDDTFVAVK